MNDIESRIAELLKDGWKRQFTINEPRLSEAVEVYLESGFEVHLEPFDPGACESGCDPGAPVNGQTSCSACYEGVEDQFKIIFTRKKAD
ncbi:hypothetical protein DSCO28_15350 [Desulfosarcina ovata subsp. sediminis]|uniref:Uncharacterized protein n=1 Tax=Desulfosarcina ovata subsp. sediminis TaxID=885957 RepID=A0A5K7ZN21_9BACT|nr:hypothetical protein [Desulfosarcina ovata]BBO80969.1 hypothetical protein DSCO28_15350 [Desulfosarcina ovata subsp. sediminis]